MIKQSVVTAFGCLSSADYICLAVAQHMYLGICRATG